MKALIVIEIDEKRLMAESNDLYDRLKGRKCELKPMPERHPIIEGRWMYENGTYSEPFGNKEYARGWNDCLNEILGETE